MDPRCDHYWEPGDVHSDWICANCGERSDIPDEPEPPIKPGSYRDGMLRMGLTEADLLDWTETNDGPQ